MSTVAEIKEAIDNLPISQRAELEAILWAEWDWPLQEKAPEPRQLREKLSAAAQGKFQPGDRGNMDRILKTLE